MTAGNCEVDEVDHQVLSTPIRAARWLTLVVGASLAVGLTVFGVVGPSGPGSEKLPSAGRVLLVSVPGLQWQDLEVSDTPHLDQWLVVGALASAATIRDRNTAADGYLTIGAGGPLGAGSLTAAIEAGGKCIAGAADMGALGQALHDAGRTTEVIGSAAAALALMGSSGCVDRYATGDDGAGSSVPGTRADVTLIELAGLERRTSASIRLERLQLIDEQLAVWAPAWEAPGTMVMVLAPVAPDGDVAMTAFGTWDPMAPDDAFFPSDRGGSLVSATTHRAGYVTLADVAPTVLALLGVPVPASMRGASIERVPDARSGTATATELADLADRASFRNRLADPAGVVLAVLLALCAVSALGRRGRTARMLAPIIVAYPTVTFLGGAVALHHLPLDFVIVAIPVVSMFVAAVVTASWSKWGRWAAVTSLLALLWAVLVIDVVTGGRLQIDTVFGMTPTLPERLHGLGVVAAALMVTSAAAVAAVPFVAARVPGPLQTGVGAERTWAWSAKLWAAWVVWITVVVLVSPAYGSSLRHILDGPLVAVATVTTVTAVGLAVPWVTSVACVPKQRRRESST